MRTTLGAALAALCLLASSAQAETVRESVTGIKLKPAWQAIEVYQDEPRSVGVRLHYKPGGPVTQTTAAGDTKEIARVVLQGLVKEGRMKDPPTSLRVRAWQSVGTGETGQPLVRRLGVTNFEPSRDALVWENE
jgi:hypothetical protein